ncbi:putative nucleotidyltransferase component of viral defense system [Bacilli bacterium PM5-3]|nr:putative nucleotidyltransferase component of viral defense system [Bacilli bacterium PM5-3]
MHDKIKTYIQSPQQLKSLIKNVSKKDNIDANTILQNYIMERFLERLSISKYRDNFILKGGFLIASLIGVDMRSTMDIDTTIKGVPINFNEIKIIIKNIINVQLNDNVFFEILSINSIRDDGKYEDYRIGILAHFFTMKIHLKLDITTGDIIIPNEIEYSFKLMFEKRYIQIKTYNINTILAEKIESILARNILNTRARDFYDVYILFLVKNKEIDKIELRNAIRKKAIERNTEIYVKKCHKYIDDIEKSSDLKKVWNKYASKYSYAANIEYCEIISVLKIILSDDIII